MKMEMRDAKLLLTITDTGIGIPNKDRDSIFSKFSRASNAVNRYADGSGLGLFVVKSYVEGWGGTIWFESREDSGTTFYILLPVSLKK